MAIQVLLGDAIARLKELPDKSVQCCVTSPPYYQLRDYGIDGQIGLEKTPEEFVEKLVNVFEEVYRVLRDDGTLWLNIGDSYVGGGGFSVTAPSTMMSKSGKYGVLGGLKPGGIKPSESVKAKDLLGVPWMLAIALRQSGWYLRSSIIWAKGISFCDSYSGSVMPESVEDRPSRGYEYVFMLSKSDTYFYNNIKEKSDDGKSMRNIRNVWAINPDPFEGAHFAVMPSKLVAICLRAGTSEKGCCPKCKSAWNRKFEVIRKSTPVKAKHVLNTSPDHKHNPNMGGETYHPIISSKMVGWEPSCNCGLAEVIPCTVLDPFGGSGTTGMVAENMGRNAILIELNSGFIKIINQRNQQTNLFC